MRSYAFLILLLMAMVIVAPVVDATICKDCNDAMPLLDPLCVTDPADHAAPQWLSGKTGSDSQRTEAAQDLCLFCSPSAAVMSSLACGAPASISHTYQLPKLLSFSNLSKSITKPPQN
jgi:hypothetical protein